METNRIYFKGLLDLTVDDTFFESKEALKFYTFTLERFEALLYRYKTLHVFKVILQRNKLGTGKISEDFIRKVLVRQEKKRKIVGVFTYTSVTPELTYETHIFFFTVGESLSEPYKHIYETFKNSPASKLTHSFGVNPPVRHDVAYTVRYSVEFIKQFSTFVGLKGDLRERGFYRVKFYTTSSLFPVLDGIPDFKPKDVTKRVNNWLDRILARFMKLFHV